MELAAMSNKVSFRLLWRYCYVGRLSHIGRMKYKTKVTPAMTPCDASIYSTRFLSHHAPFPYPDIRSTEAAKNFVVQLDDKGRSLLLEQLSRFEQEEQKQGAVAKKITINVTQVLSETEIPPVSRAQLKNVMLYHGIPFVGFGILDNMIMIIAGEYVDATIGALLGISTMAAAALGNLISDLAGVGSAGYIELLAAKVGVHPPDITPAQTTLWQIRWSVGIGRSIGIAIGCLIGMFPLLFYDHSKDNEKSDKEDGHTTDKTQDKQVVVSRS